MALERRDFFKRVGGCFAGFIATKNIDPTTIQPIATQEDFSIKKDNDFANCSGHIPHQSTSFGPCCSGYIN